MGSFERLGFVLLGAMLEAVGGRAAFQTQEVCWDLLEFTGRLISFIFVVVLAEGMPGVNSVEIEGLHLWLDSEICGSSLAVFLLCLIEVCECSLFLLLWICTSRGRVRRKMSRNQDV